MSKFCSNCGKEVDPNAYVCVSCGAKLGNNANAEGKSKLAAGLLGIFLGAFGVHNFYLGYTSKAVTQLLLGTLGSCLVIGPVISSIWGLIEGILILTGSINVDGHGQPLKD